MPQQVVTCTYIDNHELDTYVRGYLAKRRDDSAGDLERGEDGSITYNLMIDFPQWLRKLLRIPKLAFTEQVAYDAERRVCSAKALCPEANTTIDISMVPENNGTRVDCTVTLVPVFRGISVPRIAVQTFVRNRFHQERGRDNGYARVVQSQQQNSHEPEAGAPVTTTSRS